MSLATFVLVLVLILISVVLYTFASILVMEYVIYRAKEMQKEMMDALTNDLSDLDEHAKQAPGVQIFNNN